MNKFKEPLEKHHNYSLPKKGNLFARKISSDQAISSLSMNTVDGTKIGKNKSNLLSDDLVSKISEIL